MRHVQTASDDAALLACREVILSLRPQLSQVDMLAMIKEMQAEDYRIIYVTADDNPATVAAFAGFRHMQKFHTGKVIYIDDLATLPAYQGKGYASLLLGYIRDLARKEGLRAVQLDSGHDRGTAHRLYLNQGYYISAHHFTQPV
jgi:GNAT superfamily N-acetyltransferase